MNILAEKLRRPPADEFRVVIMLPGRPNNGEDDTRGQLALLAEADGRQGRFVATTAHVKMATGRDYKDVPPTRGTFRGIAEEHLHVAVETRSID